MRQIFRLTNCAGAALLLSSACVQAQTTTARLSGTVTDPSGAAVSGATVTVHNERTGEDRTVTSNSTGAFTLFSLSPAPYTLKAKASGFNTAELDHLNLLVGQEFVWNAALPLSSTSSTVTVDADQLTQVDTSSARIGGNVPSREIADLPINGRQISQLYLLVPGATNTGTGTFDSIHFSGRAVEQNIIRLDGIEATSIIDTSPGNLNGELTSLFRLQQSLEAVQEFRIDSSSYPAELGTGTGGQISFVTKSGSNNLHGDVFEYLRNDFFDARNYFNRKNTINNSPKFRLNQFGGSIGGPLMKDKLFFFAAYEGLRQTYVSAFSASTLSNYARTLVAPNSPVANLFGAFPNDPNSVATELPTAGNPSGTLSVGVTRTAPNRIQEDFGDIRFDYRINDRFSMYARYNRDQGTSFQTQDLSLSQFGQVEVPQNGALALNQVLSGKAFNETKFGFNGIKMRVTGTPGPSPNADLRASRIAVAGLTNIGSLISLSSSFNGVGAPYTGQSYSYIDNFSYIAGKHSMKFGVEIRPLSLYNNQIGGTTYTFNSIPALLANTPNQIQFYGTLSDLSPFTGLSGNAQVKQSYYIGYAQDEWRPTPNFTLSYGMRYEYYSPLHEVRNKDVVFSLSQGTIFPGYTGDWYHTSMKNFGPRIGLTFTPQTFNSLKTVIRVGGGLFYGPGQTEDQIQPEANDRVTRTFTSGKVYPINPASDVYAGYNINDPNLGYQPRAYSDNYGIPERIGTYSLSIQQELPHNYELMVGYVGSQGRNLFLRSITNLITGVSQNPGTGAAAATRQFGNRFAEIDYKTSGGSDNYNALQTTLQHRAARGFTLGAQYTYAKELGSSSGSNEASTSQQPLQVYGSGPEFGRGTFDIRHYANITALYALPFGRGLHHSLSGVTNAVAGGWEIGGIVNARSGVPIDVLITRPDLAYVGNAGTPIAGQVFSNPVVTGGVVQTTAVQNVPGGGNSRNVRRPNVVPGVNPYLKQGLQWLNPAAFSTPAPGTFGNSRRNNYSGPNLTQLDLTLQKTFTLTERVHTEFKADAYNILNHANFANPGNVRLAQAIPTSITSSNLQPGTAFSSTNAGSLFGSESSTVGNQVGLGTNRQLQLSLRVSF